MPAKPSAPERIRFTGYTNGVVGLVATENSTFTTNNAASFQRWLAAGTNGAEFTVTNQQCCDIFIYPLGRVISAGEHPTNDLTPLLNAPDFSGLRIKSGKTATVQVAVMQHGGPWRLQLYYSRNNCTDTFAHQLAGFPRDMFGLITKGSIQAQMHTMESDLIDP